MELIEESFEIELQIISLKEKLLVLIASLVVASLFVSALRHAIAGDTI